MPLVILALGFLACSLGLLVFAFYRTSVGPFAQAQTQTQTQSQANCQSLIDRAMSYTGKYCNQIGANKACYGNTTIQAQMMANASQRFSQRGDVADVTQIQSISASPLNLLTSEWGIVIFRVMANLPNSVPGQTVTLMVFGNTNLNKKSTGLDSFYFSSELGQVVCEKVSMDGILINMPDGVGWSFNVNGTELTLMGNAGLRANKNGSMMVGLYKGAGQITSDGQTQYFGAGQSVSVNLGGPNGNQAISPPSAPQLLPPDELKVACAMSGNYCTAAAISTVDAAQAQAMVQSGLTLNSSTVVPASPASTTISALPPTNVVAPTPGTVQTPAVIPTGNVTQPTTVFVNTPIPPNTPVPPNSPVSPNPPIPPKPPAPPNPPVPPNPPAPPKPPAPPNPPVPPNPPAPPNPPGTKKCNGQGNPNCAGK